MVIWRVSDNILEDQKVDALGPQRQEVIILI